MYYNSNPDGKSKSYIKNIPTTTGKHQKQARKTDVKDSIMKFLDDCEDEDLLMKSTMSPPKKLSSLSRSEHGAPRKTSALDPLDFTAAASPKNKRRAAKKEFLAGKKQTSNTFGISEHGTPSTEKRALSAMHISSKPALEDDDVSISSDEDGGVEGSMALGDSPKKHRQLSSRSNGSSSRSPGRSTSTRSPRSSGGQSSRNNHSPKTPTKESSTRSRSSTRSNLSSGRSRVSSKQESRSQSSERSVGRAPRRAHSDGAAKRRGSIGSHLASLDGDCSSSVRLRRSIAAGADSDNQSLASTRSTLSHNAKSIGLDAGPLNAFLNSGTGSRTSRRNSLSSAGHQSDLPELKSRDEEFMEMRRKKQAEIMEQAQKDRWDNMKKKERNDAIQLNEGSIHNGSLDDNDDDQPMVKGEKSIMKRLKAGISKTGKVTKSTAKGTVNVVLDPKRAARKVGGFAKGVGKETGKMLLDPKLAAKTAVSLGKDVTKGTYNVTKGITSGVASGGIGLTRTVVGSAIGGAGKVLDGASGFIFKNYSDEVEEPADYQAATLADRQKTRSSFLERFAAESDNPSPPEENKNIRAGRLKNQMPDLLIVSDDKHSWDF